MASLYNTSCSFGLASFYASLSVASHLTAVTSHFISFIFMLPIQCCTCCFPLVSFFCISPPFCIFLLWFTYLFVATLASHSFSPSVASLSVSSSRGFPLCLSSLHGVPFLSLAPVVSRQCFSVLCVPLCLLSLCLPILFIPLWPLFEYPFCLLSLWIHCLSLSYAILLFILPPAASRFLPQWWFSLLSLPTVNIHSVSPFCDFHSVSSFCLSFIWLPCLSLDLVAYHFLPSFPFVLTILSFLSMTSLSASSSWGDHFVSHVPPCLVASVASPAVPSTTGNNLLQ